MPFDEATRQRIVKALEEKGGDKPCPRCGHKEFTVAEGYVSPVLQKEYVEELEFYRFGGKRVIVSAFVICTNCGFMSQHSLVALGIV